MFLKELMPTEMPDKGNKDYFVENTRIKVMWRKFIPQHEDRESANNPSSAVLLFCGFSGNEQGKTIERLGQSLANHSRFSTYAINTRADNATNSDILLKESMATQKFLEDQRLNEVILSGHSLGGVKAINLAYLLQEKYPDVKVNGVILFNSVGLYSTASSSLGFACLKDSLLDTPVALVRKMDGLLLKQCMQANIDVMFGILEEVTDLKLGYFKRSRKILEEAATINPRLSRIEVPIVLLQGANDHISNPNELVKVHDTFSNSTIATRVISQKLGLHGLPLFRTDSAVRVGLYALKRAERKIRNDLITSQQITI